jgi:hypothetical protein
VLLISDGTRWPTFLTTVCTLSLWDIDQSFGFQGFELACANANGIGNVGSWQILPPQCFDGGNL